jgi:hypothetical protein
MLRRLPLITLLGLLAGAAYAQEREWSLDASDDEAYLIFGVPETDDVGLSLWCPIGKGLVNVYLPVTTSEIPRANDKSAPLTISAGDQTATFRGKADVNPEAAVSSVEAEIAVDHPVLKALLTADRFKVSSGAFEVIYPLYDADVAGLLDLCKKG